MEPSTVLPVEVVKDIQVPSGDVFHAFTDPALLKQWWAPDTYSCPIAKADLHAGGEYRLVARSPEGDDQWVTGTFREIIPGRRIVMENESEQLITIDFSDLVDMTRVRVRHEGVIAAAHDVCADQWSSRLRKLKHLVEQHS